MTALVHYDNFRRELAEASRVDEAKGIADKAEALRVYYHMVKDADAEAQLSEIKLRARARIGELSAGMERTDTVTRFIGPSKHGSRSGTTPIGKREVLQKAGISKDVANRCEQVARIFERDADKIEAFMARERAAKRPITEKQVLRMVGKKILREERTEKLIRRAEPFPNRRYGVILADPAWRGTPFTNSRRVENHYPTMPLEEIMALPVADLAAPDAALFLWATSPHLAEALGVLASWGFSYRSSAVWIKPSIGTGQWFRYQHEILLLGIRGNMPVPLDANRASSVIRAPRGRHSEKPDAVYEMIERGFPEFSKIELFARRARHGWERCGFEAPLQEAAE